MPLPESILLKIGWAKKHAALLETEMTGYFQGYPCHVVSEVDPNDETCMISRLEITKPMPPDFALIIGDCLQNLRTSLDYLVWELVLAAKKEPKKSNAFLFAKLQKRSKMRSLV